MELLYVLYVHRCLGSRLVLQGLILKEFNLVIFFLDHQSAKLKTYQIFPLYGIFIQLAEH